MLTSFASLLGRLDFNALPSELPTQAAAVGITLGGISVIALITYLKKWTWLYKNWLTTLDPKKIGIMYLIVSLLMLVRGFADALMLRTQQVLSVDEFHGPFSTDMFQQVFSAHGTIMIFFVAMGLMFGLMNLVVPLMIGARDVAFPFINAVSFWLFVVGMALVNISLVVGEFSNAGWLSYPPLSELAFNPGTGVDYWIWSLQISGIGSLLSGVNFVVTILKMRRPGMSLFKMPIFAWSALTSSIMIIFAFPILTVTVSLLALDRILGMHFFTADMGGNMMMYVNLIWAWGHPEVYILVIPAFGIFSEIVATFSRKRLFGYTSMVWAMVAIAFMSFLVWLHHFYTMGAGAHVNAIFGITTMIIGIPTGVKIFNWLFTMYQGRIHFSSPMIWFMGFVFLFTIGGCTGIMLAIPGIDYQVHNSLFLVAHFHNMIIAGVVFGFFAGITYWFPKIFGFRLHEGLGKAAAWSWIVGFVVAFTPLYMLGLMGATRRLDHYNSDMGWWPLFMVAGVGAMIIALGVFFQVVQLAYSIWKRKELREITGSDPWDARTLEWQAHTPVPVYNFAHLDPVTARDEFWEQKQSKKHSLAESKRVFHNIVMPKNSSLPLIIAAGSFMIGFGVIWHIWWLALIGLAVAVVTIIWRTCDDDTEYVIPAAEVEEIEKSYTHKGAQA